MVHMHNHGLTSRKAAPNSQSRENKHEKEKYKVKSVNFSDLRWEFHLKTPEVARSKGTRNHSKANVEICGHVIITPLLPLHLRMAEQ